MHNSKCPVYNYESKKAKLIRLRQENSGYNVEKAEDQGKVDQVDNFTLFVTTEDNHVITFYKEETIKNEIDFIELYPRRYGVMYKNEYYIQK